MKNNDRAVKQAVVGGVAPSYGGHPPKEDQNMKKLALAIGLAAVIAFSTSGSALAAVL